MIKNFSSEQKLKSIIDIWQTELTNQAASARHWSFLSMAEQNKAKSIKLEIQRERYIEVRALLRCVLANYLVIQPQELVISLAKYGKPYLPEQEDVHFNISHSGDHLAISVTRNNAIGIDIEQWKKQANLQALVKRCFAREEKSYWQALPDEFKQYEFYRFWTRKEALVKATGRGIGLGLDQCVISPVKPSELLRIPEKYGPVVDWTIIDLDYPVGMSGAIAAKSKEFVIRTNAISDIWP